MENAPLLKMFAWIGIAIAVSFATFHLLAPDSPRIVEPKARAETFRPSPQPTEIPGR